MEFQVIAFLVSLLSCCTLSVAAKCTCEDETLCEPLPQAMRPVKEVFGYVVLQDNWRNYNWTHITALTMLTDLSSDLLCFAHAYNVRVILSGVYPISEMNNVTKRASWIEAQFQKVHDNFADGINIDTGDTIHYKLSRNESQALIDFIGEVYSTFKSVNKAYQVLFNIPWSPDCIDVEGTSFKFANLVEVTDFLIVKAYNEQKNPCIASANSGFKTSTTGVLDYIKAGVDPGNLVLGLPWFGYDYHCTNMSEDGETCTMGNMTSLRESECTSIQLSYKQIQVIVRNTSAKVMTDSSEMSPYFNYKVEGEQHQVWFDDPDSLSFKYIFAEKQELKGLALWNIDSVSYNISDEKTIMDTVRMYTALDFF